MKLDLQAIVDAYKAPWEYVEVSVRVRKDGTVEGFEARYVLERTRG